MTNLTNFLQCFAKILFISFAINHHGKQHIDETIKTKMNITLYVCYMSEKVLSTRNQCVEGPINLLPSISLMNNIIMHYWELGLMAPRSLRWLLDLPYFEGEEEEDPEGHSPLKCFLMGITLIT
ncbi:hypothetical protein ACJX0J_022145, partial [Zea mays]